MTNPSTEEPKMTIWQRIFIFAILFFLLAVGLAFTDHYIEAIVFSALSLIGYLVVMKGEHML